MPKKYFYFFGDKKNTEGNTKMKNSLGGKGANLAEMARIGVPVPPGFTVSTEVCDLFYRSKKSFPEKLQPEFLKYVKKLEKASGKKFGDPVNPLLVSVRSGARVSMPGMMNTILNLGLNDRTAQTLAAKTKNESFAYDCYRRLIQMFGDVVMEVNREKFKITDKNLSEQEQAGLFKDIYKKECGQTFPQDPLTQLALARDAVFKSWNTPRAQTYRELYKIPHTIGTAVNIQTMVFGNMGQDSATGVGFTRDPSTGEKMFYGEYLINAQGEDVVAGIRTPHPINELKSRLPRAFNQLKQITSRLEKHYKDIQDFEFTIEKNKLYMLQTRTGKRTGPAAVKIAVDMVREGLIKQTEAVRRVQPDQLNQLLHPIFDPKEQKKFPVIAKGLNASPGAASGQVVFNADEAVAQAEAGQRVILVRSETSPNDIHGMAKARGVLTATGGQTSHAAVVGRQMGKPSVVGCGVLKVNEEKKLFVVRKDGQDITVKQGDYISIDGTTGEVMTGDVPTQESEVIQVLKEKLDPKSSKSYQHFAKLLGWADKIRRLGVRANADIPSDAALAIRLGAQGIGLCRTEHMFFAPERLPIVQKMILAKTESERKEAVNQLLPMQTQDFVGILEAMQGFPVTIRTLDPPLHEFLPKKEELMVEIATAKMELSRFESNDPKKEELVNTIQSKEKLLARVSELHEFNPMMGHRGCRLGITYPEITEMQARAIIEAACRLKQKGKKSLPEIMIPLIGTVAELTNQKAIVNRVAEEVMKKYGCKIPYTVGTMIEIPRAVLTADEIAREAEFFSYGTNDLTQMTFGYSRDDAAKFLSYYVEHKILPHDPFVSIDQTGVGELVKIGVKKGRATRPKLKIGICGEHGGDPASVIFCHHAGLDYVSCSPFRLPLARLAAAHAVLGEKS